MAELTDQSKLNISFKHILGKSQTENAWGPEGEQQGIFFNIPSTVIFADEIPFYPSDAETLGVAFKITADLVLDTGSNGHAYLAKWRAGEVWYPKNTVAGDVVKNAIPPSYNDPNDTLGRNYNAIPYDTSNNFIPETDPRAWIYQYQSGVYYQQETNGTTPSYIELYVYSGSYLSDTLSGLSFTDLKDTFTGYSDQRILFETASSITDSEYFKFDYTNVNLKVGGVILEDQPTYSISVGSGNTISGIYNSAFGFKLIVSGLSSHAEGANSLAIGDISHAEGDSTTAFGYRSHAEGFDSVAIGSISHAEGSETEAIGNSSHAEGSETAAIGSSSHAEGSYTISSGTSSHAEGSASKTIGSSSHAEGTSTTAFGISSHAEGYNTTVSGYSSHAEGYNTTAFGDYGSHTEGEYTTAIGSYSHAEGDFTTAIGDASHAEGASTIAFGISSHAEGGVSTAIGSYSHAEGSWTSAIKSYSHAEGEFSVASGLSSHAEGEHTSAIGNYSHSEGEFTTTFGASSHAEGYYTLAKGDYSHVEGYQSTTAINSIGSHAEGGATTAIGQLSHAEGTWTLSIGDYSHAEGEFSVASGLSSHAEGEYTSAIGNYSHAQNNYTIAQGLHQTVIGSYNVAQGTITTKTLNDYAFIIGKGTASNARSNALAVDWRGNLFLTSGITLGFSNNYASEISDDSGLTDASHIALPTEYAVRRYIDFQVITSTSGGTFLALTDTPSVYTANRILYEGTNAVIDSSNLTFDGTTFTTPNVSTTGLTGFNLTLNSYSVTGITDDSGLTTTSHYLLPTEYAVKKYIDDSIYSSNEFLELIDVDIPSYNVGRILFETSTGITDTPTFVFDEINKNLIVGGEMLGTQPTHSISVGSGNTTSGIYSSAFGKNLSATGSYSHAEGFKTTAFGLYSHAEGNTTTASGISSHAEGNTTIAKGDSSHAEGESSTATGLDSHVEGIYSLASGDYSHAEGAFSYAIGINSHAEGGATTSLGDVSHSEGTWTKAIGAYSHSEGEFSISSGYSSHAEGTYTTASGKFSHSQNNYTIAQGLHQTAIGSYNVAQGSNLSKVSTDYAFIIGKGTANNARSNALAVDWYGNIFSSSGLTLGFSNNYVSEISDDSGLTDASHTALVTEYAVRRYLDVLSSGVTSNITYINSTPVPVTIGGIEQNSTFSGLSMQDMWTELLYPYQPPAFGSFTNNYKANYLEVGETLPTVSALTFNWTMTNPSNANNDIFIYDVTSGETLASSISAGTPSSITMAINYNITKTTSTTHTWRIQGTNTLATIYNTTTSRSWIWRFHWGSSLFTGLTSADILTLSNSGLRTSVAQSINYAIVSPPEYKYYCIPSSYSLSNITLGGFDVDMAGTTPYTSGFDVGATRNIYYHLISHTNTYGVTTNYKVFRTANELGGAITLIYT